ncbi:hypothetical protein OAG05_02465, partial [Akkermansiaceae bacterium]|nr:hypothetical protein [Akkermansiaceae bacterium]
MPSRTLWILIYPIAKVYRLHLGRLLHPPAHIRCLCLPKTAMSSQRNTLERLDASLFRLPFWQ